MTGNHEQTEWHMAQGLPAERDASGDMQFATFGVEDLPNVLMDQGVEKALEIARTTDGRYIPQMLTVVESAALGLLHSGEPDKQSRALDYLEWDAKHDYDIEDGEAITYSAKYDARHETTRPLAERMMRIALQHFRSAAASEDFAPDAAFCEKFNHTISRIQEEGFEELGNEALVEFAPVLIRAAKEFEPQGDDSIDARYETWMVDEALEHIVFSLYETHPELAIEARDLVRGERSQRFVSTITDDMDLKQAMLAGDFETGKGKLTGNILADFDKLWKPMFKRLVDAGGNEDAWGNQVIDEALSARPDFFSGFGERDDDSMDLLLDEAAGKVVGYLDRRDVMDMLFPGHERKNIGEGTAQSVAYGLGLRNNEEGYDYLKSRVTNIDSRVAGFILKCYELGRSGEVRY